MKLLKRLLFIPAILIFGCISIPISIIGLILWILTGQTSILDWYNSIGDEIVDYLILKDES